MNNPYISLNISEEKIRGGKILTGTTVAPRLHDQATFCLTCKMLTIFWHFNWYIGEEDDFFWVWPRHEKSPSRLRSRIGLSLTSRRYMFHVNQHWPCDSLVIQKAGGRGPGADRELRITLVNWNMHCINVNNLQQKRTWFMWNRVCQKFFFGGRGRWS